ncbi:MAG TPA: tyrosine-protein phosphatase [Nocardioides sp.]|nr:tyrosine-protein phosphatase [Nocardioides sp.]
MNLGGDAVWEGARNLADLGGLPRRDGTETVTGRVWRSGATEWMTTSGWRAAKTAGLVSVVDLRNDIERGRQPDQPVVDASVLSGIEVVHAPTEDPDDPLFLAECGPWLDHPRSWGPNARRYPAKFARVFTAIADSPGPVLVHCAGGRDRTGMIVSMLLVLADVEPAAIAECYADGFRRAASHRGHGLGYDPNSKQWVPAEDEVWDPEGLERAVADRTPMVLEWLRTADVAGYLHEAGIDAERLSILRRLLAE